MATNAITQPTCAVYGCARLVNSRYDDDQSVCSNHAYDSHVDHREWKEYWIVEHGHGQPRPYFHCEHSNETTWHLPEGSKTIDGEWMVCRTQTPRRRWYYYNTWKKESTWFLAPSSHPRYTWHISMNKPSQPGKLRKSRYVRHI